jgi:hypothetical protein
VYSPIDGFSVLDSPIDRAAILSRTEAILAVRDVLKSKTSEPLYFPFAPYRDGVRAYQSYLAKFPRELLAVFPELSPPLLGLLETGETPSLSEADEAEQHVAELAGKRRSGQGRRVDPLVRAAIEAHAMNAAYAHFSAFGTVEDKSSTESYDFAVRIDGIEWHVEVKGTSTDGNSVLLTPNEVKHARTYPYVALFVLSNIEVGGASEELTACGGTPLVLHPWVMDERSLLPTGFEYTIST